MARKVPNQKKLRTAASATKAKKPMPPAKSAKPAKPVAKKPDVKVKPAAAKEVAKPVAGKAADAAKSKVPPAKVKGAAPAKGAPVKPGKEAKPAKEPKAAKEPPVKKKRKGPAIVRLKAFWGVFNQMAKRVAVFEFAEQKLAVKKAADLSVSAKQPHFVQLVKEIIRESE